MKMLKTKFTELLGTKHPIIQAGMGPFSNNNLCVAASNAGALGLLSSSGLFQKEVNPLVYNSFVETSEASPNDDLAGILTSVLKRTYRLVKDKGGVFGVNVLCSAEVLFRAELVITTAAKVVQENPDMKNYFKVIFTSAGDPVPWRDKIKNAGFKWLHVVPSVKGAQRCQKAGVDCIVASGHEGGFHTAWEPVHSMTLLPAVVDALAGSNIPVMGAGGFCDGKTLAAALMLGAAGVQMGTRFLATQESDFPPLWKEQVVETPDRGSLVARGAVGPARWLKMPKTLEHQKNTLLKSPSLFLDTPDDSNSPSTKELVAFERKGIAAAFTGDRENAMMAGGECAQRVNDLPTVQDLVDRIAKEAADILRNVPNFVVG
jgi:NAD(P)H-dependent flavin oxidoreductase YrpB (nitropropane dioxygenase family)